MKYTSIDEIVRGNLFTRSLHFYVQMTMYAVECLKELQYDVLGTIKSKKIEINEFGAIELPCDYMDMVRIGFNRSERIVSLSSVQNSNRLINLDEAGNRVEYGGDGWQYGRYYGSWAYAGSYYGGRSYNGFTVIAERNEIQLQNVCGNFIILDYITDGTEVDNASMVHPYAAAAIRQYIDWKMKKSNRAYSGADAEMEHNLYKLAEKKLRGRINPMKVADVIASWYRGYGKQK